MPFRSYLQGLLQAERFAERQALLEVDRKVHQAVDSARAKASTRGPVRSLVPSGCGSPERFGPGREKEELTDGS